MAAAAAAAAAADAPFLWLRLGGLALSEVREVRARGGAMAAASANVANAGVDGLLARPLLVVTGVADGAAGGVGGGGIAVVDSFFDSSSLAAGFAEPSFLPGVAE